MLNYDKPSRIFPCILLTRNHMIFLLQFGINKHKFFFKDHKFHSPLRARIILLVFKKIYSCLYIPNCTRNHVNTYAYLHFLFSWNKRWFNSQTGRLLQKVMGSRKKLFFLFPAQPFNSCSPNDMILIRNKKKLGVSLGWINWNSRETEFL